MLFPFGGAKLITVSAVTSIILVVTGCGGSGSNSSTGPKVGRFGTLEFTVATDKVKYAHAEVVTISYNLRNTGSV